MTLRSGRRDENVRRTKLLGKRQAPRRSAYEEDATAPEIDSRCPAAEWIVPEKRLN